MKNKITSYFTFGILLIVIGAIGFFLQWEQAVVFMGMGLLFEFLVVLIFVWEKIKNRS